MSTGSSILSHAQEYATLKLASVRSVCCQRLLFKYAHNGCLCCKRWPQTMHKRETHYKTAVGIPFGHLSQHLMHLSNYHLHHVFCAVSLWIYLTGRSTMIFLGIFAFLLFECHHTATLKTTHRQAKMSHTSQTTETHLPQHGCISNTTRTQHWDNHNTILTQDRKERKKHEKLSLRFSASLISTIASFLHVFKTSLRSKRNSEETEETTSF